MAMRIMSVGDKRDQAFSKDDDHRGGGQDDIIVDSLNNMVTRIMSVGDKRDQASLVKMMTTEVVGRMTS